MAQTSAAAAVEISRAFVDLMRASRGGHDKPHGEALRAGIASGLAQAAARRRCRVLAARRAEARRAAADRRRAAERACRASALRDAERWPSRRSARFVARERFGAARLARPRPARA